MEQKLCERGLHFYDASKFASCPHCRIVAAPGVRGPEIGQTEGYGVSPAAPATPGNPAIPATRATTPVGGRDEQQYTRRRTDASPIEEGATQIYMGEQQGKTPHVVGWLVCTDGPAMGKDFRLFFGNNKIGRDGRVNVVQITGDDGISRDGHAVIQYDNRENSFYIHSDAQARNPTIHNGKMVRAWTKLEAHDVIQMGRTVLVFVPFCTDQFKWGDSLMGEPNS